MISSWRRSLELTVGTGRLIWVSLVSLLLELTMLLHNPLPMKRLLVCSSVLWLKRVLIKILIHFQPDHHQIELAEAHRLYLSGNVWQHISSKHAKKDDYRMVDTLPTIIKAGAESSKWRQHGYALFVKCKTLQFKVWQRIFSAACRLHPFGPNIELSLTLLIYYVEY